MDSATEAPPEYLYVNEKLSFSALRQKRFALVWKPWTARYIRITPQGVLSYARPRAALADPHNKTVPRHKLFLLEKVEVSLLTDNQMDDTTDIGILVKCLTMDHIETCFRCIMSDQELEPFLQTIKKVAKEHNVDRIPRSEIKVATNKKKWYMFRSKQSVMRRAVSHAMDRYDRRSTRERILAKRQAFKYLPVMLSNDLIHGSWWFVWGSVGVVITSLVMIDNKYHGEFNQDDSVLSLTGFVASWFMMLLSGIFSTLGSLAFVRAFHENPPMPPMFRTYYHVQSDELLASWLFFLATIPFVPYVIIFLAAEGYNSMLYLLALAFAIVAALGSLLFVRACYPSDRSHTHRDLLLPLSKWLCCCFSAKSREYYFMNDWLGGSWSFYWACALATFATVILFFVSIADRNPLQQFMYGTSLIESAMFMIGSAYFVAGSYPEEGQGSGGENMEGGMSAQEERGDDASQASDSSKHEGEVIEKKKGSLRLSLTNNAQYEVFQETNAV